MVEVEHRESTQHKYGRGRTMRMSFSRFLDRIASNDQLLYMTTQNLETSEEGRPDLMAPPVTLVCVERVAAIMMVIAADRGLPPASQHPRWSGSRFLIERLW
jgi:hypothetical protein